MVAVIGCLWLLVLPPLASASHEDDCAGGDDAPGYFDDDWNTAPSLGTPTDCSGSVSDTGGSSSFGASDNDLYRFPVPLGAVISTVVVRVCIETDEFSLAYAALHFNDALREATGARPPTVASQGNMEDGDCFVHLARRTAPFSLGGAAWYVEVDGLPACCPPSSITYTLHVDVFNVPAS